MAPSVIFRNVNFKFLHNFPYFFYRDLFGKHNTGINFDKYEDIPVEATGQDVPKNVELVSYGSSSQLDFISLQLKLIIHCAFLFLFVSLLIATLVKFCITTFRYVAR